MSNCNFNCCRTGPYYPREIFTCSCLNRCSIGTIVNPQVPREWAVFGLDTTTTVLADGVIPVTLLRSSGTAITDGGAGNVNLTAGVYQISYNVTATVPEGGLVSIVLELGGTEIATTNSLMSGTEGDAVSLSNQIIINLTDSQVLNLINKTDSNVSFESANISITKL